MSKGPNFSIQETNLLLDCVEDILPMGGDQWERLAMDYKRRAGPHATVRDADGLKLKFKRLRLTKKPTGDPNCPPEVRRAKSLFYKIESEIETNMPPSEISDDGNSDAVGKNDTQNEQEIQCNHRLNASCEDHANSVSAQDQDTEKRSTASKRIGKSHNELLAMSSILRKRPHAENNIDPMLLFMMEAERKRDERNERFEREREERNAQFQLLLTTVLSKLCDKKEEY